MKLDNKEFDVLPKHMNDFFTVLDGFEKIVLSKDLSKESITPEQESTFCIYIVSDHAIGLPKEAKKLLESFITYL